MNRIERRLIRHQRIRKKVSGTSLCPRLSIYKSLKYIYAQVIDDEKGITLTHASTNESFIKGNSKSYKNKDSAKKLGEILSERIKEKNVRAVVLDRGGFRYHGVIKELADTLRNGGIEF